MIHILNKPYEGELEHSFKHKYIENQIKGKEYEIQIRDYIINNLNKQAFLWEDTPEKILINSKIIGNHNNNRLIRKNNKENPIQDTGIDVIQVNEDGLCSLVQCKNGYNNGLTIKDLSGFMSWMACLNNLYGYVYYTSKLSNPIKTLPITDRIKFIKCDYLNNHNTINDNINDNINNNIIKPFDYQIKASELFINHFKENDRGILSMPCGTGKTMTSFLISNKYKQIIIFSPLKQFSKQNLDKFIEYGYNNNTLLVNSDGERDVNKINDFIKNNESFLISSTFCSADAINKCLENTNNPLIIIDEFHNLSKTNIFDENDNMNQILDSYYKILFMSATPRIYELENDDFDGELLFGKIVYKMSFSEAINNNYITNYKIWLPSISENNSSLNSELQIYQINNLIKAKCNFLFSCLLNNGSKKCIIYCQDTNEIKEMKKAIILLNEYYLLNLDINQITSENSWIERDNILNHFEKNNNTQLLFSVRILDECIDIQSCDSIYITYESQSKIRTIQRLSRCIRKDKNNNYKIGNIFIWCDEYSKILETLSGIKEYDESFNQKIKLNEINFFGETKKEDINKDLILIEKYIINIKEYRKLTWCEKLNELKDYIKNYNKLPSQFDLDNNIRSLHIWLSNQKQYYKKNIKSMSDIENREKWKNFINDSKYIKYFISGNDNWINKLNDIKIFIDINKRRPHEKLENEKILGKWISHQIANYKNNKEIMNDENIRNTWKKFIEDEKYSIYFLSNTEYWLLILQKTEKYIIENKRRPSHANNNSDETKVLGRWISQQIVSYKKKDKIMKDPIIVKKFEEFIKNPLYSKYF